jgi:hypothetical protein
VAATARGWGGGGRLRLSRSPVTHYCDPKMPFPHSILSQMNPIHTDILLKVAVLVFTNDLFRPEFPTELLYSFDTSQSVSEAPPKSPPLIHRQLNTRKLASIRFSTTSAREESNRFSPFRYATLSRLRVPSLWAFRAATPCSLVG